LSNSQENELIGVNYYDYHITCRPKKIETGDNFWSKYLCLAECGKARVPSIYEYTICKVTTCKGEKCV